MKPPFEQLLADMQNVLDDLEGLVRAAQEEKGGAAHADAARIGRLKSALQKARERLGEHLERSRNAADQYVRDHAWKLLGVAAVFVLGMLMSRRRD
jgi:ElaB/YqjD/DUF883 family membrane-anchored ribosome-binding protein